MSRTSKKTSQEKLNKDRAQAASFIPYKVPQPGENSGLWADIEERIVNFALCKYTQALETQPQGTFDVVKYRMVDGKRKRTKIEVKSGGGKIASIDAEGNIVSSKLLEGDFVAYCYRLDINKGVEQFRFFETSDFMDLLRRFKLIRTAYEGAQRTAYQAGLPAYHNKMQIQTCEQKGGEKKKQRFLDAIDFEGLTIEDFVDFYGINVKINYL